MRAKPSYSLHGDGQIHRAEDAEPAAGLSKQAGGDSRPSELRTGGIYSPDRGVSYRVCNLRIGSYIQNRFF